MRTATLRTLFFICLKPDTKRCKPHGAPSTWPLEDRESYMSFSLADSHSYPGKIYPQRFSQWHTSTSSTAQGGGGSFKNRKPIGEVGCCESRMAERIHWWTERWLRSPLFLSLSLSFSLFLWLPTYLPIYLSIYLSSYLSIYIYISIYLSICLSIYLSNYLSISLSLSHLSIYLSICLTIYLSIYLSVCLSVCLSICLSARLKTKLFYETSWFF